MSAQGNPIASPRMKPVLVRYVLRNGSRGCLHMLAASTTEGVMQCLELFGEAVRCCSARAA